MACRVGITTQPETRKRRWQSRYQRLWRWEIIDRYRSKSAAQKREIQKANEHGCDYHPGGSGPERATWHVYHFYY